MILQKYKINIAIMASGSGTNAENLIKCIKTNSNLNLECVITDHGDAGVIKRAAENNVDCCIYEVNKNLTNISHSKIQHENVILNELKKRQVTWVFLAGYMRILSSNFIEAFWDKEIGNSTIVNIHPSLLPLFPGRDAYRQVWESEVSMTGATVHHVDAGVDTGEIILQDSMSISRDNGFSKFKENGLKLEHKLYRKALEHLFKVEKFNDEI